jgi:hypothetical protein
LVDGADYLGQVVLQAAVLPARAAYLIAEGSEAGFRRAVEEASSRWGGMTEPIIPVRPGGGVEDWWRQVVRLAGADAAVNVNVPDGDAAAASGQLGLELVPLARIDAAGPSMFTVHAAWAGPPSLPGEQNGYCIGQEKGQLWEITAAGDLPQEHLIKLSTDVLWVDRHASDHVARCQVWGRTLIDRTVSQFREHEAQGGPSPCPAIVWITEPDSIADCVYFWNLRALRPLRFRTVPMILLPVGQVQHWIGFAGQLHRALERPEEFAPDVVVCSLSVEEDRLHKEAVRLGLQPFTGKAWVRQASDAPLRQPPFTYRLDVEVRSLFVFGRRYGEVTSVDAHLLRSSTMVRFTSPVTFRGGGFALVQLSGSPFDSLPKRPAVADRIFKGARWNQDALQVTTLAQDDYWLDLHIPDPREAVGAVLGEVTISNELSDKGKLGMAWLDGKDVGPLLEPGVLTAIRALTTPRSKDMLRELQKLRADGAVDDEFAELAARWGGRVERRYRDPAQVGNLAVPDAARALERLCALGWAERGLRLTCDRCGLTGFVPLPAATGQASCPGCASPATYDIGSSLTVCYRLDSYLDQLSDQGVLPHLLAVAALTRQGRESFFLPGVNLRFGANAEDRAEADLFGIRDGQILCGEVKTSAAAFTEDQITRDVELSAKLGADTHVLATTDDLPSNIIEMAEAACTARSLKLIAMGRNDLLPT